MQVRLLCVEKQTYSSVWTVGKRFSYASCVPNHPHGTRLPEPANRSRRAQQQQPPPVPRRNQSSAAARARRRYPVSVCVGSPVVTMQHVVERLRQKRHIKYTESPSRSARRKTKKKRQKKISHTRHLSEDAKDSTTKLSVLYIFFLLSNKNFKLNSKTFRRQSACERRATVRKRRKTTAPRAARATPSGFFPPLNYYSFILFFLKRNPRQNALGDISTGLMIHSETKTPTLGC